MTSTILILPGLNNSGPGHWQTIWEQTLPGAVRVQQRDWDAPRREDWVAVLDEAIRQASDQVVLVAHSLGCVTVAWWAFGHGNEIHAAKVRGALLVAPPDVERPDFPKFVTGFAPMPVGTLPFSAIVAASTDDPWCAFERAQAWASAWGAEFRSVGPLGHINAASGLANWPQGRAWVEEMFAARPLPAR